MTASQKRAPALVGDPAMAAQLLHHIVNGFDVVHEEDGRVRLLGTLDLYLFDKLCQWGADREDDEDNGDAELDAWVHA